MPSKIILQPGREKSLLRRHPWLFSGAIASLKGPEPELGESVEIADAHGQFLAWAAYSPNSQIRARIWSFDQNKPMSKALLEEFLLRCIRRRTESGFIMDGQQAFRLINAESDGLPGCVIDVYGTILVCQFLSSGWELWRDSLCELLRQHLPDCTGILERSDSDSRVKEGLHERKGLLSGVVPSHVEILENGLRLIIDPWKGHKTGYYLDQRDARAAVTRYSKDREVLNAFCYTGGFGLKALQGGAKHVVQMDVSGDSLEIARQNTVLNGLPLDRVEWSENDVFHELRKYRDRGRQFDLIILDPPKFAESQATLEKAARGYKDINLLGLKLLRPGGLLFTFSCSGLMGAEFFGKIIADAAVDAKRECQIIDRFFQPADHPVAPVFPEGLYLKGLLVRA
jgi:23S rRNA (cytosine1962-C5)-methyltransferase